MPDQLFDVLILTWLSVITGVLVYIWRGMGKEERNKIVNVPQVLDLLGVKEIGPGNGSALVLSGSGVQRVAVPTIIIRRGRDGTFEQRFSFPMGAAFLENVTAWRTVGIEGRLGGGKTLLSVAIAKWLYETGKVRGVFSNFPIRQSYIPYIPSCINTAVVLDEGAEWADARDSAKGHKGYGKYFRKLGSYLLTPSVYSVDRRMRPVTVERDLDLFMFGLWLYKWHDPRGQKGSFLMSGFESIFNMYDHRFIPADDGGVLETLQGEIKQLAGSRRQILLLNDRPEQLEDVYVNPLELSDGRIR